VVRAKLKVGTGEVTIGSRALKIRGDQEEAERITEVQLIDGGYSILKTGEVRYLGKRRKIWYFLKGEMCGFVTIGISAGKLPFVIEGFFDMEYIKKLEELAMGVIDGLKFK
jgi:hypothetical protein